MVRVNENWNVTKKYGGKARISQKPTFPNKLTSPTSPPNNFPKNQSKNLSNTTD